MKRSIVLACFALVLGSPISSPGGDLPLMGPHEKAWLHIVSKDPRLQVRMAISVSDPSIEQWLEELRKGTGLSITLADPPKVGRIASRLFFNPKDKLPAWAIMRAGAHNNFVEPRWEKTETGYRLHGKPNHVVSPERDAELAARKKADDEEVERLNKPWNDFAAKYPHLAVLRKDRRLFVKLTVQEQSLKLPELVRRLEEATNLKLTFADNLKHHDPDLGTYLDMRPGFFNAENHPAWQLMEYIGQQEVDDGRWIATKVGYHLEGKSQRLNPPAPPPAQKPAATPTPIPTPPAAPEAAPAARSSNWLWLPLGGVTLALGAAGVYRWRSKKSG